MKKMKILTLLLCASLAFAYMGCSNSSGGSDSGTSTPSGNNGNGTGGGQQDSSLPTGDFTQTGYHETGSSVEINGISYKIVTFGNYPQSLKADNVTVSSTATDVNGFVCYKGSDNEWYVKHGESGNEKYFKVEPIKWRVLNPAATGSEKKMLLAENVLINCAYYDFYNVNRTIGNATVYPNNYEHSRVRAFLNGLSYQKKESNSAEQTSETVFEGKGFLQTAFTAEEIAAIAETSVVNNARSTNPDGDSNASLWNSGDNTYASDTPTKDKLFLLSEQEATKSAYGFAECDVYDSEGKALGERNTRIRDATAFAQAKGAYQKDVEGYGGYWWLRSPYCEPSDSSASGKVHDVSYKGRGSGSEIVQSDWYGVVPALCLK